MKEKIIQIVRNIASASGDSLADVADIYEENYFKKEIDELSTLIQEEKKEAVRGFEESIFFGETILVDGKTYISTEHIQDVKKEYLSSIGKDEE